MAIGSLISFRENLRCFPAFYRSGGRSMKRGLSRVLLLSLALPGAVALAESRMEKTLKLDPGNEFIIDTDLGRVTVTGASASGVRLVVTSRRELDDLLHFEYEEGSGRAMVRARKKHSDWGFFSDGGSNVRFEIEVPAQTTVRVHTSGGAISLSGTRAPANLHTSGGGIEVRGLQGDLRRTPRVARSASGTSAARRASRPPAAESTHSTSRAPFRPRRAEARSTPTGSPGTCACTARAAASTSARRAGRSKPTPPEARSTRSSRAATRGAEAWSPPAAGSRSRSIPPSAWRSTPAATRSRATCR